MARRLDGQAVRDLVDAYEAGPTARQLAEQFSLARSTVICLLRQHGVTIRHPRLSPEECAEIVALYESGLSQVTIAQQFGRHKAVIWHVLQPGSRVSRKLEKTFRAT